jgi:hypothetical protein
MTAIPSKAFGAAVVSAADGHSRTAAVQGTIRNSHSLVARATACRRGRALLRAPQDVARWHGPCSMHPDPVRLFVLFLGTVPKIDLAGAELLRELHATLRADAITFRLAEAHGEVRDALRRLGFEHEYGPLEPGQDVDLIVTRWQASMLGNQIAGSPITGERLVADGAPAD